MIVKSNDENPKVIYSRRKGARLYDDVLIQDVDKPKFCEKWKTK